MPFKDPEKAKEYRRQRYLKNPEKFAYSYGNNKEYQRKSHEKNKLKRKNKELLKSFGITLNQYNIMFEKQNGLCAICHNPEAGIDKRTGKLFMFSVDHDHKTGKIRQLLCGACNMALGLMQDSPDRLRNAALYIEKHLSNQLN